MPAAASLGKLQRQFQKALFDEAPHRERGFEVHRQTTLRAAIDALQANFPAVACLVGEAWFRSAAAAYAAENPARDVRLAMYGASFAAFLDEAPAALELPYLADVARLDRLWLESYLAADRVPMGVDAVRGIAAEALGALQVMPHPATRTLLATTPVHSIWQASRIGEAVGEDLLWEPQAVLITRPFDTVEVSQVSPAVLAFLDACRDGAPLASCIAHIASTHRSAQADRVFAHLLTAGALALA